MLCAMCEALEGAQSVLLVEGSVEVFAVASVMLMHCRKRGALRVLATLCAEHRSAHDNAFKATEGIFDEMMKDAEARVS